jgi:hypothetical protein
MVRTESYFLGDHDFDVMAASQLQISLLIRVWGTPILSGSFLFVREVLEKGPFEVQWRARPICLSALALTKVMSSTHMTSA